MGGKPAPEPVAWILRLESRFLGPAGKESPKLLQSALCKGAREDGGGPGELQASTPTQGNHYKHWQPGATLPHVVSLLSWVEAQALELSYPGSHPSFLLTCCVTLGKLSKLSEPLCPTRQVGTGLMQCHRKHDDCRRWSIGSIYGVLGTY